MAQSCCRNHGMFNIHKARFASCIWQYRYRYTLTILIFIDGSIYLTASVRHVCDSQRVSAVPCIKMYRSTYISLFISLQAYNGASLNLIWNPEGGKEGTGEGRCTFCHWTLTDVLIASWLRQVAFRPWRKRAPNIEVRYKCGVFHKTYDDGTFCKQTDPYYLDFCDPLWSI